MNREVLISKISEDAQISKKQSGVALNAFVEGIMLALEKGEKVSLVGFGSFSVVERKERKGVNPQTGESITIPKRKVPVFKPGKKLKDALK